MTVTTRNCQRTETVVCEVEVRDEADALADPSTSMNIVIADPDGTEVVASTAMTKDSTGVYHYDYTPSGSAVLGWYSVHYIATDGARVTVEDDGFTLEA